MNKDYIYTIGKICVLFIICTITFYLCLRVLQIDYEQNKRYDLPEQPSVKVQHIKK